MNLQDLAAIGEALGGTAVLITLVYLAYQLRQTASIERTAGQRDLLKQGRDWFELTLDSALFDVVSRGMNDWESVSAAEKEQCSAWCFSFLFCAEQALYMHRDGLINEASFRGVLKGALDIIATPGGRIWWQGARLTLGDDISNHIDEKLALRSASELDWRQILPHRTIGHAA